MLPQVYLVAIVCSLYNRCKQLQTDPLLRQVATNVDDSENNDEFTAVFTDDTTHCHNHRPHAS